MSANANAGVFASPSQRYLQATANMDDMNSTNNINNNGYAANTSAVYSGSTAHATGSDALNITDANAADVSTSGFNTSTFKIVKPMTQEERPEMTPLRFPQPTQQLYGQQQVQLQQQTHAFTSLASDHVDTRTTQNAMVMTAANAAGSTYDVPTSGAATHYGGFVSLATATADMWEVDKTVNSHAHSGANSCSSSNGDANSNHRANASRSTNGIDSYGYNRDFSFRLPMRADYLNNDTVVTASTNNTLHSNANGSVAVSFNTKNAGANANNSSGDNAKAVGMINNSLIDVNNVSTGMGNAGVALHNVSTGASTSGIDKSALRSAWLQHISTHIVETHSATSTAAGTSTSNHALLSQARAADTYNRTEATGGVIGSDDNANENNMQTEAVMTVTLTEPVLETPPQQNTDVAAKHHDDQESQNQPQQMLLPLILQLDQHSPSYSAVPSPSNALNSYLDGPRRPHFAPNHLYPRLVEDQFDDAGVSDAQRDGAIVRHSPDLSAVSSSSSSADNSFTAATYNRPSAPVAFMHFNGNNRSLNHSNDEETVNNSLGNGGYTNYLAGRSSKNMFFAFGTPSSTTTTTNSSGNGVTTTTTTTTNTSDTGNNEDCVNDDNADVNAVAVGNDSSAMSPFGSPAPAYVSTAAAVAAHMGAKTGEIARKSARYSLKATAAAATAAALASVASSSIANANSIRSATVSSSSNTDFVSTSLYAPASSEIAANAQSLVRSEVKPRQRLVLHMYQGDDHDDNDDERKTDVDIASRSVRKGLAFDDVDSDNDTDRAINTMHHVHNSTAAVAGNESDGEQSDCEDNAGVAHIQHVQYGHNDNVHNSDDEDAGDDDTATDDAPGADYGNFPQGSRDASPERSFASPVHRHSPPDRRHSTRSRPRTTTKNSDGSVNAVMSDNATAVATLDTEFAAAASALLAIAPLPAVTSTQSVVATASTVSAVPATPTLPKPVSSSPDSSSNGMLSPAARSQLRLLRKKLTPPTNNSTNPAETGSKPVGAVSHSTAPQPAEMAPLTDVAKLSGAKWRAALEAVAFGDVDEGAAVEAEIESEYAELYQRSNDTYTNSVNHEHNAQSQHLHLRSRSRSRSRTRVNLAQLDDYSHSRSRSRSQLQSRSRSQSRSQSVTPRMGALVAQMAELELTAGGLGNMTSPRRRSYISSLNNTAENAGAVDNGLESMQLPTVNSYRELDDADSDETREHADVNDSATSATSGNSTVQLRCLLRWQRARPNTATVSATNSALASTAVSSVGQSPRRHSAVNTPRRPHTAPSNVHGETCAMSPRGHSSSPNASTNRSANSEGVVSIPLTRSQHVDGADTSKYLSSGYLDWVSALIHHPRANSTSASVVDMSNSDTCSESNVANMQSMPATSTEPVFRNRVIYPFARHSVSSTLARSRPLLLLLQTNGPAPDLLSVRVLYGGKQSAQLAQTARLWPIPVPPSLQDANLARLASGDSLVAVEVPTVVTLPGESAGNGGWAVPTGIYLEFDRANPLNALVRLMHTC